MLGAERLFVQHKAARNAHKIFIVPGSDHLTFLEIFEAYVSLPAYKRKQWCWNNFFRWSSLHVADLTVQQIRSKMQGLGLPVTALRGCSRGPSIEECLGKSLRLQTATLENGELGMYLGGGYDLGTYMVHPSSVLAKPFPVAVVYQELVQSSTNSGSFSRSKVYMRGVSRVPKECVPYT